ncbi:hypothetical protein CcaverHIS002_0202020 [Cutaneotrichosporon cavernicola]|uniref:PWWP domain-containing protein n=1 Tax=Cutaneotrichosporon cavernicola TaxID=279322 RepID=A0AA48IF22_9TREE|nr:uncharacterized protein CcaverHIS019_0202050 [Cutaneotrichosporon cavernicola]BEI81042.1 hypothetical protein CcaverHIS002_0202020 [Cutaneotrichosporon cavernicola]BEI88843.1 hypothetical protein CcaverHIS019_0202050 [Cutaneotrichosporon cavernicola]BEI96618.1 hypothetical protein CcaverHIS631_0202070 [Cutaneotrichosporon cavernicola]
MSEEAAPAIDGGVKPASKRNSGGAKPRKSGGAAKKGPAPQEVAKCEYGDIVLARLRGFPPWPARITDPESLPANVLALRPKNPAFQCAQFFPVGDYSWLPPKEIQPLKKHQIQSFLNEGHRKAAGNLREAYETALDPSEWDQVQDEYRRDREAAEAEADEDVDELEEEEGEDGQPAGKKRKRAAPAPKKDAKKAKVTKKAEDKPKPKADKPKSKETDKADESKSEGAAPALGEEEAPDPEAVKVKDWRHKLQRAFLQKGVPTATEMDQYDDLFKTIENYGDMKIEYLQFSKIGKVMKKIAALTNVPRDDELKITSRAEKLMKEWTDFINRSEGPGAPAANGSAGKADKAETTTSPTNNESTAPAAPAVEDPPAPEAPASEEPTAPNTEDIKVDA